MPIFYPRHLTSKWRLNLVLLRFLFLLFRFVIGRGLLRWRREIYFGFFRLCLLVVGRFVRIYFIGRFRLFLFVLVLLVVSLLMDCWRCVRIYHGLNCRRRCLCLLEFRFGPCLVQDLLFRILLLLLCALFALLFLMQID